MLRPNLCQPGGDCRFHPRGDDIRGVSWWVLGYCSCGETDDAEARARCRNAYLVARQMYAPAVLLGLWSASKDQFIPHWVVIHKGEIVDLKSIQFDWVDTESSGSPSKVLLSVEWDSTDGGQQPGGSDHLRRGSAADCRECAAGWVLSSGPGVYKRDTVIACKGQHQVTFARSALRSYSGGPLQWARRRR